MAAGAENPADGRRADLVAEASQLAVHPSVPQAGFSPASRSTRSRTSWVAAGRPGRLGKVHLRVIRRRCHASSGPGVTSRLPRRAAGSSRASAARIARSAQTGSMMSGRFALGEEDGWGSRLIYRLQRLIICSQEDFGGSNFHTVSPHSLPFGSL